jgi:predicted secreted protein
MEECGDKVAGSLRAARIRHHQAGGAIPKGTMLSSSSRQFRSFLAPYRRCVSFTVKNIFKVKLADPQLAPQTAARQAEIEDGVQLLLRSAKPVHRDNVLAAALATPMRQCIVHKYALPSAFLLRFLCAYKGNQVRHAAVSRLSKPESTFVTAFSGNNRI